MIELEERKKFETVEAVERKRERELLFIQHGICLLDHTGNFIEKIKGVNAFIIDGIKGRLL